MTIKVGSVCKLKMAPEHPEVTVVSLRETAMGPTATVMHEVDGETKYADHPTANIVLSETAKQPEVSKTGRRGGKNKAAPAAE